MAPAAQRQINPVFTKTAAPVESAEIIVLYGPARPRSNEEIRLRQFAEQSRMLQEGLAKLPPKEPLANAVQQQFRPSFNATHAEQAAMQESRGSAFPIYRPLIS